MGLAAVLALVALALAEVALAALPFAAAAVPVAGFYAALFAAAVVLVVAAAFVTDEAGWPFLAALAAWLAFGSAGEEDTCAFAY